jgi:hypothetical protein
MVTNLHPIGLGISEQDQSLFSFLVIRRKERVKTGIVRLIGLTLDRDYS